MDSKKVVVGISGGTDSAVCAARLKAQGYNVTGVFLDTGLKTSAAVQRVCKQLGIPWVTESIRDELRERVMIPFAQSVCRGMSSNPCVLCNYSVKFPALIRMADRLNAQYIATGHYVKREDYEGVTYLRQGVEGWDQSHMLYRLPQSILSRCLFPLGELSKETVRTEARNLGLYYSETSEGLKICFSQSGNHGRFAENMGYTAHAGDIVDSIGRVLGKHSGLHHYTVGQRYATAAPAGTPSSPAPESLYVVALDSVQRHVVVGPERMLYPPGFTVGAVVLAPGLEMPLEVDVRVSGDGKPAPAVVKAMSGGQATVTFSAEPIRAPEPGQSAVFYQDDVVAGGGFIQRW